MFFAITTVGSIKGIAGIKALVILAIFVVIAGQLITWICRDTDKAERNDQDNK